MLRALDGDRSDTRASDEYVAQLFDAFADHFDEKLVGQLNYRAPAIIMDALSARLPSPARQELSILDAGCGTGRCGPLLRPFARRLVGVDLSAGMLERAEASEAYDELRVGELVGAMEAEPDSYDLIVAADVLVYFGALDEVLRAAARALRPAGLAAVTVERHDDGDYALRASGRYAHSASYLRATAERAGLEVLDVQDCVCRWESGGPLAAYVAVLRAPAEPS